ncbi:MAG: folate-binding protein YgfZ [Pseudomonadales bacterium]|nr:folate-binding protein YgfZ [Pseudomonadales bacterium]MCP5331152.1 folate-binding protein YgfZ [Pseudomonadales bacterium]MCP5343615.1 folate-binding protein YgfZ [Pseudomonadales bacterium]
MASTVTDLNNFDLLGICGEDAGQFLQGQLSGNLDKLSSTHSLRAAYCDLKGRVISDMQVLQGSHCIYLLCLSGMGATLRRILDKYIVFSKASTQLLSQDFEHYGIHGEGARQTLVELFGQAPENPGDVVQQEDALAFRLTDAEPRYEVLLPRSGHNMLERMQSLGITDDTESWDLCDIRQGIIHIHPDIQETYTPQLLNYDINGVIDFRKGCYTGQEIVARMHYRGTAKKRLYLGKSREHVSVQTQLMHGTEPVGEILSVSRNETGGYEFLVILPCELAANDANLLLQNEGEASSGKGSAPVELLSIPDLQTH